MIYVNGSQSLVPRNPWAHPQPVESETLGVGPSNLCSVSKIARWFWCSLKFELALKLNVLNPTVYFSFPVFLTSPFLLIASQSPSFAAINILEVIFTFSCCLLFQSFIVKTAHFVPKIFLKIDSFSLILGPQKSNPKASLTSQPIPSLWSFILFCS